jgi:large subunit ribosomal protein L19
MAQAKAKTKAKAKTRTAKTKKTSGVETNLVRRVTFKPVQKNVADFRSGDTVGVYVKVKEGDKERIQLYKGVVTKVQGSGSSKAFTVRKISAGVGVERTFPFLSPAVDRVELIATGKVRRSKLYYLRGLDGKAARIESELVTSGSASVGSAKAEAAVEE